MSLIIPDSVVNMYADVPISGGHQLVFSSKNAQTNYFANKRLVTKAGCSYIRKTGRLRIEFNAARVQQCNYMSFTNTSFEDVTFYAKIIDYEYVNNVTTDVIYAIDYWQTYMFDAKFHACNIIREHLTEFDYQLAVTNPWRRDVAELLTDEGLPCDKTLEKLYDKTQYSDGFTGEMTSLVRSAYSLYSVMLISEFDFSEWDEADKTEFMNSIEYFGSGNIDIDNPSLPTSMNALFGGIDNNFPNAIALIGVNMYNTDKLDKLLDLMTIYGVSGSVVGIYALPDYMLAGYFRDVGFKSNSITPFIINPTIDSSVDPKLNTFPFKYLRILTPKDIKEYRLDQFKALAEGYGSFKLNMVGSVNGLPRLTLYPVDYQYDAGGIGNFYERLNFENFPQVSYSIDAYLSFLSGQYSQAIASNTLSGQSSLVAAHQEAMAGQGSALLGATTAPISGVANVLGNIAQGDFGAAVSSGVGMGNMVNEQAASIARAQAKFEQTQQQINVQNEAQGARTGSSGVFYGTKRAYINDQYVAGGTGIYGMYQVNGVVFDLQIVTLNQDIIDKYDAYFKCYGYKSLRSGRPHICDYVTDGTNAPHFNTYDDETFTYVQTENMHVTGLQQAACTFIENLFNSGCRFVKGD